MLMGVIDAAEEAKSPVIISFGSGFVGNTSFEDFSHMIGINGTKSNGAGNNSLGIMVGVWRLFITPGLMV